MRGLVCEICVVLVVASCFSSGYAQRRQTEVKKRKLIVFVCSEDGEAISGVVLCSKGQGVPSEPTDGTGRTLLDLTDEASPGEPIDLMLMQGVPANRDWEIPPGIRTLIHTFQNKPNAFTTVTLRNKTVRREVERLVLQAGGGDSEASHDLRKSLADIISDHIRLGHYHYSYGRFSDALNAYGKALENSPDNDDVLFSIALTLAKLERNEEALSSIEKCLALRKVKPESLDLASTYESYALLLIRMNRKDDAEGQLAVARGIRERVKGSSKR